MKPLKSVSSAGFVALTLGWGAPSICLAETYHWNGGTDWGDFGTAANWSTGGKLDAGGTVAEAAPGEGDFISCDPTLSGGTYYLGYFDLGGQNRTIMGWGAPTVNWKSQMVYLRNGTLIVKEPADTASGKSTMTGRRFVIESTGRLVYPAGNQGTGALAGSGLPESWTIKDGGVMEVYAGIGVQGPGSSYTTSEIREGGKLVFDPSKLIVPSSNSGGFSIDNYGTLELPHGLNWADSGWSSGGAGEDRLRVRQMKGRTILGGDFKKTGQEKSMPGRMTFVLGGGTLEVTNDVSFFTAETAYVASSNWYEQVYAEMPDTATATVDVNAGGSIDMSLFTYGAGASLTKAGAGKMTLAARPETLTVSAGTVAFAEPLEGLDGVTFADGVTVEFDAKGNSIASLANADNLSFTVGADFSDGDVIVTSANAELLRAIYANFELPDSLKTDYNVRVKDGALIVYLSVPVEVRLRDLTLYVGDAVTNAGYAVVNQKTGEIISNADIQGTPTYVCDYTPDSGPGTYEISMEGLRSETLEIKAFRAATITVVPADERLIFYWNGGQPFGDFGAVSNWTMDAEHEIEATRLPGRNDFIAHRTEQYGSTVKGSNYHVGKWDLCGGARDFYAYTTGTVFKTWQNWWVDITNGTLTVNDPTCFAGSPTGGVLPIGHLYNVWDGATLVYPAKTYAANYFAASGLLEYWAVHAGGTVRAEGGLFFSSADSQTGGALVEEGGTLVFTPEQLSVSSTNARGVEFVNRGTMLCPNGLVWSGTGYNQSTKAASGRDEMFFIQEAGTMVLGGNVMRTNNYWASNVKMPSRLELILKGGTLRVSNTVRVATSENSYKTHIEKWGEEAAGIYRTQAFASLADAADVLVDLMPGSLLDMTAFAYGADAKLTTTGTGRILFGATLPPMLTIDGGAVDYATPTAEAVAGTVKLGENATGDFPLRVWKNGLGATVNDALDLTDGLVGSFVIRPKAYGFRFAIGDTIRLGAYDAVAELPDAAFAGRGWEFCRQAGDADALYMRYVGVGMMLLVQ